MMSDATRPDEPSDDATPRDEERAVYIISVAAELAGVHPQTLRIYERKGLVRPHRTSGNTRRYSERDIQILRQIQDLTQDGGINLAGVKMIIELQAQLDALRTQTAQLQQQLRERADAAEDERARKLVPLRSVFLPPWQGGSSR
jgi:MerR family transcriptional regulator/heat shock protein HspR